jgi:hypothetical protein
MNSPSSNNLIARSASANLEERVHRALEQKPEPQIPVDFAARVAGRAVAQPIRRRRSTAQFGKLMALVCAVLSGAALFALAPHAAPNVKSLSFDAEVVLLAELAFIGAWVSRLSART